MESILQGVASNAIFFILLLVLGGVWFLFWRRQLLSLFRVSSSKQLTIYLSRIQVQRGGAVGPDGLARTFQGSTVTTIESSCASQIAGLFEYLMPGLQAQPGILKTLLTRDISVSVSPSPQIFAPQSVVGTIVTVGSPGYNSVSAWAQGLNPKAAFSQNNDRIVTQTNRQITDPTIGVVQILYDAQSQRRVFYLAGLSEAGTSAALLYVALKWQKLYSLLGSNDVVCCLVKVQNGQVVLQETIN